MFNLCGLMLSFNLFGSMAFLCRDGIEEDIAALVEQQGPTVAATVGLTAAAGGTVLLLASVLQPLLSGQLASSSKLTELLQQISQQQVLPQQDVQQPAGLAPQSGSSHDSAVTTAAAAGDAAAAAAIASEPSTGLKLAENSSEQDAASAAPAAAVAASGKPAAVRARLLDNVDLDAAESISPSTAAGAAELPPRVIWARSSSSGRVGSSSSSSSSSSIGVPDRAAVAGLDGILWQQAEGSRPGSAAPAGEVGGAGGGILWQRNEPLTTELTSTTRPSVASDYGVDPFTGPVMWQQQQQQKGNELAMGLSPPPLQQQQHLTTPDVEELSGPAAQVSGSNSSVLWQRSESLPAAAAAAGAAEAGSFLLGAQSATGGRGPWSSRLLSNAEDAAAVAAMQVSEALPAYHQQQWQQRDLPWQQQQQQRSWQPWQQAYSRDDHLVSSNFVKSGSEAESRDSSPDMHGQDRQQQQQHGSTYRNSKDLWPVIMSTSTTVVAYTSLASADVDGDAAVGLVMPDQLPADPWGTTPAGLAAAVQDLADLGLLSSVTAALVAGIAGPVPPVNSSPWDVVSDGSLTN
jgi:hypothetical protein